MKAYLVSDEYGDAGAVVAFADHSVVARREGASELDCDFESVKCRRYPAFDEYATQGYVPDEVLVKHGWWFECMQCSQRICSDPTDADGEEIELHPIYEPNRVYCSPECKEAFEANRRAEAARADEVAAAALAKWPGITIRHKNGYMSPPHVWFNFPNGTQQASWQLGAETLEVARCDQDAWHAYAAEIKRTALTE